MANDNNTGGIPLDLLRSQAIKDAPSSPTQLPPTNQDIAAQIAAARQTVTDQTPALGDFIQSAFSADNAASQMLRQREFRNYLLIQNTDSSGNLYVSFGQAATALSSIIIGPGGYYEPRVVPQNEIYILGNEAAVTGVVIIGK